MTTADASTHSPIVSIVITAYQAEAHVARAMRSACALEGPWPYEVILFDDGSSDGTVAAARRVADEDDRVRVIDGGRLGRAKALNAAIARTSGRFIAILDADDIALPGRLLATVPLLEKTDGTALACTDALVFDDIPPQVPAESGAAIVAPMSPAALYISNRIVHSTVLFRKADWEAVGGYDETLDICVDYSFYFRLLTRGGIALSSAVTCLRHRRPDSYFASKDRATYTDTLARIREHARERFPIPLWAQLAATASTAKFNLGALTHQMFDTRGAA